MIRVRQNRPGNDLGRLPGTAAHTPLSKGCIMHSITTTHQPASPFDSIKKVREDGTEYWSARDLMPLLGYDKWQNFAAAADRAKIAAEVQGHDVGNLFVGTVKKTGGRPQQDYELTRFACDLIAMNSDPRKPEVISLRAGIPFDQSKAPKAPSEYVYFIEAPTVRMVKIGTARKPLNRLSALQVGSPVPLHIIGTILGAEKWKNSFTSSSATTIATVNGSACPQKSKHISTTSPHERYPHMSSLIPLTTAGDGVQAVMGRDLYGGVSILVLLRLLFPW